MLSLPHALALSLRQLADPAILRVLGKSLALTLALFAALAVALHHAVPLLLGRWFALDGDVYLALSLLLFALGAWLLFRFVALAVLQFFADDVVRAVEARHYPDAAASARDLPFAVELRHSLRATTRALLVNLLALPLALALLITGVGTALVFWAVNAWLLGRELQDMVWLRHRRADDEAAPLSGATRFLLGGAIAALLAIPFVNLLAPIIGAASATHLVHRRRPGTPHA